MLYALQRSLLFPAPPPRPVPTRAGTLLDERSPSGRRVVALWSPSPRGESSAPTLVYLHGNGMQLADSASLAPLLQAEGWNVYCVEYPGYGPLSEERPGEEALIDTAEAAMTLLRTKLSVPVERTVLVGQSLGTGVAAVLAARGRASKLALVSPYRSIPKVASGIFPWLPVRLLIRDRFDTESLAPEISLPVSVIHGTADEVIPFSHGAHLASLFPRGSLTRVEGGHHNDLWVAFRAEIVGALRALTSHERSSR